jgi:hypothetical protein
VVPGFDMPLRVTLDWPHLTLIRPTETWQRAKVRLPNPTDFRIDPNFYVVPLQRDAAAARDERPAPRAPRAPAQTPQVE